MARHSGSQTRNPYDLNVTLKDRKQVERKNPSPSARSPYTLSHESSLRSIVVLSKKR
jgi:hypothetical protein